MLPFFISSFFLVFQLGYTTIFGFFASIVYVRTGSKRFFSYSFDFFFFSGCVHSAVICHSFCNLMGFPNIGAALSHKHRNGLTNSTIYLLSFFLFQFLSDSTMLCLGGHCFCSSLQHFA